MSEPTFKKARTRSDTKAAREGAPPYAPRWCQAPEEVPAAPTAISWRDHLHGATASGRPRPDGYVEFTAENGFSVWVHFGHVVCPPPPDGADLGPLGPALGAAPVAPPPQGRPPAAWDQPTTLMTRRGPSANSPWEPAHFVKHAYGMAGWGAVVTIGDDTAEPRAPAHLLLAGQPRLFGELPSLEQPLYAPSGMVSFDGGRHHHPATQLVSSGTLLLSITGGPPPPFCNVAPLDAARLGEPAPSSDPPPLSALDTSRWFEHGRGAAAFERGRAAAAAAGGGKPPPAAAADGGRKPPQPAEPATPESTGGATPRRRSAAHETAFLAFSSAEQLRAAAPEGMPEEAAGFKMAPNCLYVQASSGVFRPVRVDMDALAAPPAGAPRVEAAWAKAGRKITDGAIRALLAPYDPALIDKRAPADAVRRAKAKDTARPRSPTAADDIAAEHGLSPPAFRELVRNIAAVTNTPTADVQAALEQRDYSAATTELIENPPPGHLRQGAVLHKPAMQTVLRLGTQLAAWISRTGATEAPPVAALAFIEHLHQQTETRSPGKATVSHGLACPHSDQRNARLCSPGDGCVPQLKASTLKLYCRALATHGGLPDGWAAASTSPMVTNHLKTLATEQARLGRAVSKADRLYAAGAEWIHTAFDCLIEAIPDVRPQDIAKRMNLCRQQCLFALGCEPRRRGTEIGRLEWNKLAVFERSDGTLVLASKLEARKTFSSSKLAACVIDPHRRHSSIQLLHTIHQHYADIGVDPPKFVFAKVAWSADQGRYYMEKPTGSAGEGNLVYNVITTQMVNATLRKICKPELHLLPATMLDKGFQFTIKSARVGNAIVATSAGINVPKHMGWVDHSRMGGGLQPGRVGRQRPRLLTGRGTGPREREDDQRSPRVPSGPMTRPTARDKTHT